MGDPLPTKLPRALETYKSYKFTDAAIQKATEGALARVPEGDKSALVVYGSAEAGVSWGVAVAYKKGADWTIVVAAAQEREKPLGVEASVVHSW